MATTFDIHCSLPVRLPLEEFEAAQYQHITYSAALSIFLRRLAQLEDIEKVSSPAVGTTVYAPVQKPRKPGRDPHQPLPGDSVTIAAWRQRMGSRSISGRIRFKIQSHRTIRHPVKYAG